MNPSPYSSTTCGDAHVRSDVTLRAPEPPWSRITPGCGPCEVRVLEAVPEHRDSVLSVEERPENASMMTCVSRCRGTRLVLDL